VLREGDLFDRAIAFYEKTLSLSRSRIRSIVFVKVADARPLTSPAYDIGQSKESVKRQWVQHYLQLWGLANADLRQADHAQSQDPTDW
jgi:hypothetical protein